MSSITPNEKISVIVLYEINTNCTVINECNPDDTDSVAEWMTDEIKKILKRCDAQQVIAEIQIIPMVLNQKTYDKFKVEELLSHS